MRKYAHWGKKRASTFLNSVYNSLQFPHEMNTNGSKTPTTCMPFHTNYDYGADWLINT